MKNKKQIIGFSLLIVLSSTFLFCCLYLPLFHIKLCNLSNGDEIINQNFSFLEFVKADIFRTYPDALDVFDGSPGPVWLTVSMIYLNLLTIIGCVILFALSLIGLVCTFFNKTFSLKNSAVYKTGGFVGGFAILTFIAQMAGFIVITSLANNYIVFNALYGCYINCIVGVLIVVAGCFIKNKVNLLTENKVRDFVFFLLTAVCGIAFAVVLIYTKQFYFIEDQFATILGLNQIATEFATLLVAGDIPFGVSFYVMIVILIGVAFLVIYSIIGAVRVLMGKSANWLSIRIKRWSRAVLDFFSILFIFLICCIIIYHLNIVIVDGSNFVVVLTPGFYVQCILPFVLVIITRFVGVYNNTQTEEVTNA